MENDYTAYLAQMNDEQLGLFWIIASERARQWIQGELVRRAAARGELPVSARSSVPTDRSAIAAA
jgi:hypothetical protein